MKKILLFILLAMPILGISQSTDLEKIRKRNEQSFRNRNFHPHFYNPTPWFWTPSYYYVPYFYTYPTLGNTRSESNLDFSGSIGFSAPIQYNESNVGFGVWGSFGKNVVFIMSYDMVSVNSYIHYWDITHRDAKAWGDEYIGIEKQIDVVSFGAGKKIGYFTPYASLSMLLEDGFAIYFDNSYILSNSGYYTIYDYNTVKFGPSFGTLIDIKRLQLNLSFNLQREIVGLGVGYKF